MAGRARLDVDELAEDRARHLADLADAVAGRAGLVAGLAALGARAAAHLARDVLAHLDLLLGPLGDLLERERELDAEVAARTSLPGPTSAARPPTEDLLEDAAPARRAEDVAEGAEDVGDVLEALAAPRTGAVADARVAEAVVALALLGRGEDFVGLGGLFELRLGLVVAGVAVGVVLEGELAVSPLDLHRRRVPLDAQYLVIIAHF